MNGTLHRILTKAYGIRFVIIVNAKAGSFSLVPLLISIGSGVGLLSIATIVVDCILLHFAKNKKVYREIKQLRYDNSVSILL